MNHSSFSLANLTIVVIRVCLCIQATEGFATQDTQGASIQAKRTADLAFDDKSGSGFTVIDPDKVQEFDAIRGICVDSDNSDELVSGASVQLYRKASARNGLKASDELVASAESTMDGAFAFDNLQARFKTSKFDSYFLIVVRKPGYAAQFEASTSWDSGNRRISLARRAMVRGVVRNEEMQPVANALVSFYHPLKNSLPDVYSAKTDSEGKFQINDFHRLNSPVNVQKDGTRQSAFQLPIHVVHPDYGSVSLLVDRTPNIFLIKVVRGAKFSGKTVDAAGKSVANCRIAMQSHNGEAAYIWLETASDDKGEFKFVKSPFVRCNLCFATDKLIGAAIEVAGNAGSETDLGKLVLKSPVRIEGIVIDDENDEPLQRMNGYVESIGWHGPEHPKTSPGVSAAAIGEDGKFECRFLPGLNFPYVAAGTLETVGNPWSDGIEIYPNSTMKLEIRVVRKAPGNPQFNRD